MISIYFIVRDQLYDVDSFILFLGQAEKEAKKTGKDMGGTGQRTASCLKERAGYVAFSFTFNARSESSLGGEELFCGKENSSS